MRPRGDRMYAWVILVLGIQAIGTLVIFVYWASQSDTVTPELLKASSSSRISMQPHKIDDGMKRRSTHSTVVTLGSSNPSASALNSSSRVLGKVVNSRYRTLWTAGWNARDAMYFQDPAPVVRWDARAESVFEEEWRRLQFPQSCDSVKGWFVIEPLSWGLTSVARDYLSSLLRGMAKNYTVVYKDGFRFCPADMAGRYIDCYWQDLGSCQSSWSRTGGGGGGGGAPVLHQAWPDAVKRVETEEFPHWLWERMRSYVTITRTGGKEEEQGLVVVDDTVLDPQLYLQVKLSVLRAIMAKVVLRPRDHIMASANKLVHEWRARGAAASVGNRGLVIHLRRTDKIKDQGPHWRHIDLSPSSTHIGPLVQRMESSLNTSFPHFLILSDDTRFLHHHSQAVHDLASHFTSPSVVPLRSDLLCHFLGDDHKAFDKGGHEAMDEVSRAKLYVYAAIAVSDYIIGSGSCGVSQFIAQNLGARHRVEPGQVALWEDDIVVEECRTWMDEVISYHSRCEEWRNNETLRGAAKAKADLSLKKWRDRDCSVFVPLPEMVVCL